MSKDDDFQLDVIDRLARLETKIDAFNGTQKKSCDKIEELEKRVNNSDTQLSTIKKCFIAVGAIIGVISTCLGIVMAVMGMI